MSHNGLTKWRNKMNGIFKFAYKGAAYRTVFAMLLAVVTMGLTGCGRNFSAIPKPMAPYENPDINRTQWGEIDTISSIAVITGEPAPQILEYSERTVRNVVIQRTVFENPTMLPGENYLQLHVVYNPYAYEPRIVYSDLIQSINWDEEAVHETLETEFPDMRVQIDSQVMTNIYGIYSFANARAGRDNNCIYVWQSINEDERVLPDTIRALGIEFRYCSADMSTGQMLDIYSRMMMRFESGILPLIDATSPTRETIYRAQKLPVGPRYVPER